MELERSSHDNYILELYEMLNKNILIAYRGVFDNSVLTVIAKNIELAVQNQPKVSKRIFKIFLELAQNISFYSAEKKHQEDANELGEGILILTDYVNYYTLATGNLAVKGKVSAITKKIEMINSLDREGLREFKRQLRGLPYGERGGANIGLIQVALTAESKISHQIKSVNNDLDFISISVKISKSLQN